MNLFDALKGWEKLGYPAPVGHDNENNHYVIPFLDNNGVEKGRVTVYPGQGIRWSYPRELFGNSKRNRTGYNERRAY